MLSVFKSESISGGGFRYAGVSYNRLFSFIEEDFII